MSDALARKRAERAARRYAEGGSVLDDADEYLRRKYHEEGAGFGTKALTTLGMVPVGIARAAARAGTAAKRSLTDADFDPVSEAQNAAGFITTGGIGLSKAGLGPKGDVLGMGVGKAADDAPKLHSDNPGGDWLKYKQQESAKEGKNPWGAPARMGSVTGTFNKEVTVPVSVLAQLKGMRGEQNQVRPDDLAWLKKNMESGKLPKTKRGNEYAPFVTVDQNGNAWVSEGNHRIMAADQLGWHSMPVEVRYFNGGENVPGPLSPDNIAKWHGLPRLKE